MARQSTFESSGDALDELEGETVPRVEIGVEGRRPAVRVHRRPAVDEAHQVEGPAEHGRVLARGDRGRVRHVGPGERREDAPLAQDALVARGRRAGRRDAQGSLQIAATDLVDLVLRAPGQEALRERLGATTQAAGVHPCDEAFEIDHSFPGSMSTMLAR